MVAIDACMRERRFALGYDRCYGSVRASRANGVVCVKNPSFFGVQLKERGYHYCALRHSPAHACKGRLVVDHDHFCAVGHVTMVHACPQCVRGFLCASGNAQMAAWDLEYQARGTIYLPPEVADYIEGRPLRDPLASVPRRPH